ncbi:COP9 signalosome complex subunit 7 isoform X1 [Zea mays]|uniref:PCI domain-containing protein n=1 Tax=Zea mays TaxID=4577 RepID=A0A804UED7_MAIZE|nr:COP9 signalosome complex subunit 7 isoform X1 [Zea mays]|eukprot:XP_008651512.1 COP9 signalosome complex subunit 7 isoform X1 [Zea mays]
MAMDAERRQAELIAQFSSQAVALSSAQQLAALVLEATSHPALFAFSELLALPALSMLAGTQYSSSLDLLRLFAYGTLKDYKNNSGSLPALLPDQVRKLKQLSVLTLAESTKILPYDQLMQELDVSNVRELEDFLINECMYSGIVRGKLDQLRRCFEVQFAAGRDLTPDQLNNMIEILSDWLGTSDSLLHQIQEKIKWADTMSDVNKKHQKEFEDRVEEAKKSIKQADIDIRGHDDYLSESVGIMDFEEDRVRPKRRRQPLA